MAIPRQTPGSSGTAWLRQLGDEDLMPLVAGGDPRAFETIYERHATAVFSLAYRICGVRGTAEEVAQEAFLTIWRSGARYDRTRGSVRTWLLGIAHNRAIDVLRRNAVHDRRRAADERAAAELESPEHTDAEAVRRETARSIRTLMDQLPNEQRRVVDLAYFGGFTHEEIARMLDAPVGTVKGRMRLALEKLRASLADQEVPA
ncbi:MAG TPA: RNA polymerase sigma factor [Solirubrobacteraceae bacterium]|nr:RNA polymerase sigma factor [Solirubrobacteraceae bacterium]